MPRRRKHISALEATIGKSLRELRQRRGMTQAEMAKTLGINQSRISEYERGDLRVPGAVIVRIANALKVSTDEALGLEKPKTATLMNNRRLLRRLRRVDELPVADQRALIRFLDALLARHGMSGRVKSASRANESRASRSVQKRTPNKARRTRVA